MNVDFSEIFTYSNITFAIAILGALLSVYNFTKDIVQNRFKMHIAFRSYKPCPIRFNHKSFRFLMSIENRSHTALSISRILLKHQDKVYDFNCLPQRVYTWEEKTEKMLLIECASIPYRFPSTFRVWVLSAVILWLKPPWTHRTTFQTGNSSS